MKKYGAWSEQASTKFRTSSDNKELILYPPATLTNASLELTLPDVSGGTDTLVSRISTDTLQNKTLTNPIISTIINTGTLTLPTSTDTLVGRATTDTLTNKTIDGDNNTIQDLALGTLKTTANLNVFLQRDGSGDVIDSAKSVPSGDILGTSDSQAITNKTIDADSNTITNIENADIKAAAAIAVDKLAALTVNRAVQSSATGFLEVSSVTNIELGYLSGVTSSIQSQFGGKQDDVITTEGDVIVGDGSGDAARLGIGLNGQVLTSNGTTASWQSVAGTGDVTAAANLTDHTIIRGDGGVKGVQDSGISIDDSDNITGVVGLTASGTITGDTLNADTIQDEAGTGAPSFPNHFELPNRVHNPGNANYTVTDTDGYDTITFDTTLTADRTVTLPTASDNTGRQLTIKKNDSSEYRVLVTEEGTDAIDGYSTVVVPLQYDFITIQSNGTTWHIINRKETSAWKAYTPTTNGLGTISGVNLRWRRVGENAEISGYFTPGTATSSEARIGLPFDLTSNTPGTDDISVGMLYKDDSIQTNYTLLCDYDDTFVTIGRQRFTAADNPLSSRNGNSIFGTSVRTSIRATVPIQEWTDTV